MEGSAEDVGAPDSWESADLEESMRRLLVSSKKGSESFSSPPCQSQDFAEEIPMVHPIAAVASLAPSATSGERCGVLSEGSLNQVDLFLREALEKPRERLSILRMEQDIIKFICDPAQQQLEFQDLPTSYLRLAAHRVAQHYYLQSVAMPDVPDGSGSRIVIRKTSYCGLPPVRLSDIPVSLQLEDSSNTLKVAIKQRPQKNLQGGNSLNKFSSNANILKTVEERKEEYNKARARIFSHNNDAALRLKQSLKHLCLISFTIAPLFRQVLMMHFYLKDVKLTSRRA
ncbi:hypothetical protein HPP92_005159 [Vanilla planifolia]|uniref:R3H domain-containing protein n=1 Tax=Vanilla planifolia TaxID=51239 RepID=A0A835RKV1_VANPL|nr:hypothetical protein HPP92_005159 [Vanilla planifolia]